jgi:hypothetical protein
MKLIKIFKKVINCKILFKLPKNIDLVIFDNVAVKSLKKNLLKDLNYFVLKSRHYEVDEVYLSLKLFKKITKNFKYFFSKNFSIQDIYFLSLIEALEPKVVFTFIDNSYQFSSIAQNIDDKKIKFIALQNGMRHSWQLQNYMFEKKLTKYNLNKKLYIPFYLCFSEFDKSQCKTLGLNIGKFKLVGSLRLANFLLEIKNSKIKKIYDICLVSDYGAWMDYFDKKQLDIFEQVQNGYVKLIKWTINYSIKNNLKFVFAFKKTENTLSFFQEKNFYKKKLNDEEYNFLISNASFNTEKNYFNSYFLSFQSELTIAKTSTILREVFVCNNKILACNLTGSNLFDYPVDGFFALNNSSFEKFENRISEILSLSNDSYFSKIYKPKNYLVHHNNPEVIIESIKKELTVDSGQNL